MQDRLRKVSPGPSNFMMIFRSSRLSFHKMRSSSFVRRQFYRVSACNHCLHCLSSVLAHVSHWRSDITLTIYLRLPLVPVPARSCWPDRGSPGAGQLYTLNRWPLVCLAPLSQADGPGRCCSCTDGGLSRSQETPSSSQPITPIVIEASLFVGEAERDGEGRGTYCPRSQMIHNNLNPA